MQDAEPSAAYCRAYNRWIVDFCSQSDGRLIPIAHLSTTDGKEAARELERAVRAGAKGGFIAPFTWTGKAPGHSYYDPLWAAAQDLDVPLALHPTFEPLSRTVHTRFEELAPTEPLNFSWYFDVLVAQGMQQAFTSLFHYGLFDRFPRVKAVVLESQAGWIGYLLDRMDAVYKDPLELDEVPSPRYCGLLCGLACARRLPTTRVARSVSLSHEEAPPVLTLSPYGGGCKVRASQAVHATARDCMLSPPAVR